MFQTETLRERCSPTKDDQTPSRTRRRTDAVQKVLVEEGEPERERNKGRQGLGSPSQSQNSNASPGVGSDRDSLSALVNGARCSEDLFDVEMFS